MTESVYSLVPPWKRSMVILRIKGWLARTFNTYIVTAKQKQDKAVEHAEKQVLASVNFVLDELIGAEPGWFLMNGKKWEIYSTDYCKQLGKYYRVLASPLCLSFKAGSSVDQMLKNSGIYVSGPTVSKDSGCYYWNIILPVK